MIGSIFFNLSIKEPDGTLTEENLERSQVDNKTNGIITEVQPRIKKTIDIYFSAGLNEVDSDGKTTKSCNRNNNWNCGIYKITWDFISESATDHELIYDSYENGELSPNLSPNNKFLAFEQRKYDSRDRDIFIINVKPGNHVTPNHIVGSNTTTFINDDSSRLLRKARFPHWRNDEELFFSADNFEGLVYDPYKGTPHWGDLYMAPIITRKKNAFLDGDSVKIIVGDENSLKDEKYLVSLQDTYVNPKNTKMVAGHGKTSKECAPLSECEGFPYIVQFKTDNLTSPSYKKVKIEKVKKRSNMINTFSDGLTSCAHLAFSPDGKYIICTEQHTDDKINNGEGQKATSKEKVEQDNLYVFENKYKGVTINNLSKDLGDLSKKVNDPTALFEWEPVGDGPLFKHKSPQQLFNLDRNFKTAKYAEDLDKGVLPSGEYCNSKFQHKLAEFCGENHYVVARVACQTNQYGYPEQFLYSRIFLIDFQNKLKPKYHDITGAFEKLSGKNHGTFHSQSATCGNYINSLDLRR